METNRIVLDGDLVLKTVEGVKNLLLTVTENMTDLEIEFRNLGKWDIAGVQLLYALKRHYALHNRQVVFRFASPEHAEKCQEWIDLLNSHL